MCAQCILTHAQCRLPEAQQHALWLVQYAKSGTIVYIFLLGDVYQVTKLFLFQ